MKNIHHNIDVVTDIIENVILDISWKLLSGGKR